MHLSRVPWLCRLPAPLPFLQPTPAPSPLQPTRPYPQVLQALWDGSEGSGLGERQRLEKLFELWGGVAEVSKLEQMPVSSF